jgi:hypothetical protein
MLVTVGVRLSQRACGHIHPVEGACGTMTKVSSAEEYATLIDLGDPESQDRLRNETISEDVWLQIIAVRPDLVRAVTLNKNLPESVIRILALNTDPNVRSDIAMKRSLPADLFQKLSEDIDESVRTHIAFNKKTPRAILERLMDDDCPVVSEAARKRKDEQGSPC